MSDPGRGRWRWPASGRDGSPVSTACLGCLKREKEGPGKGGKTGDCRMPQQLRESRGRGAFALCLGYYLLSRCTEMVAFGLSAHKWR